METSRMRVPTVANFSFEPLYTFCRDRIIKQNFASAELTTPWKNHLKWLKKGEAPPYAKVDKFEIEIINYYVEKSASLIK